MSHTQTEIISLLSTNRDAYPHKVSNIVVEETHISWVFLTGKFVYKVKKGLKFGNVLDFSTLNLRKGYCQKEVEINRVLCRQMYRGVVKVVSRKEKQQDEGYGIRVVNLHRKGKALEYAVKILEIPQEFRMDNLLEKGKIKSDTIDKLSSKLVKFHHSTPTNMRIKRFGLPEFMKKKLDENFVTLSKLADVNHKFERSLDLFLKNNDNLFRERIRDEKIRDIHGDLYLKNIFITSHKKFYLYDRLEFNDILRYADVAEDVAHLAMDLDFHGRQDLRNHFISTYIQQSKDTSLEDIIYFFMCYKACVRAKVSLFRVKGLNKSKVSDANNKMKQAKKEAKLHLQLAESYLERL
jgi:aminoglycoside phosphotransferase family enzyme